MKTSPKVYFVLAFLTLFAAGGVFAQTQSTDQEAIRYTQVITERAAKIVAKLSLADSSVARRVQQTIAGQYRSLNDIHEQAKKEPGNEAETNGKLTRLHETYLAQLANELTVSQIEEVKDGMTYGVLPITYKGYQAMLPNLTEAQKTQILTYLTEARERAMDAGSSEKKHAVFGKYKGKINNYLSAAGIDVNKASKEWQSSIK